VGHNGIKTVMVVIVIGLGTEQGGGMTHLQDADVSLKETHIFQVTTSTWASMQESTCPKQNNGIKTHTLNQIFLVGPWSTM
jgi:hypothetical protein